MNEQKVTNCADVRNEFRDKVKSWFQNKGILNKLELYLKNQMILEFQRDCGTCVRLQNTTLSPKHQAIQVLVGDFLVQEDLLFSLSVYCTEVPLLSNFTQYNQYITRLADSSKEAASAKRPPKPEFSKEELLYVLEALNLNLKAGEFDTFHNVYKSEKKISLLTSLLCTIPKLIKKNRTFEYLLKKARRREKLFQKLLKLGKSKLKNMYAVVQKAYGVVEKHKSDMNELLRNQNAMANDEEKNELSKKAYELSEWQKKLQIKEHSLEEAYQNRLQEVEEKRKTLEKRELDLQSKYQMVHKEKSELRLDRKRFELTKDQCQTIHGGQPDQLQEIEQKFYALQVEVREMLATYNEVRQQQNIEDDKSTQTKCSREQRTKTEIFPHVAEYMNFMEKENTFLKLNCNKQHDHISQLTDQIIILKSQLDYLEKKAEISKNIRFEIQPQKFPQTQLHHSNSGNDDGYACESFISRPSSRRKLFEENEISQPRASTSSNTPRGANLTDNIIADANSKVEALENESEALDRNCRNLHNILSRNIALSESKISSPRSSQLSRSYSDAGSLNVSADIWKFALSTSCRNAANSDNEQKFKTSSPRMSQMPLVARRSNSFREMFVRRRKERARLKRTESEYSSTSSSPRERIDCSVDSEDLSPIKHVSNELTNSEGINRDQDTENDVAAAGT